MSMKFSFFAIFLIVALVSPIFAREPCSCQTLPSTVGAIIGNLDDVIDEVISGVIDPVDSAVSSLVDNY
jgi:phage-related protein